MAFASSLFCSSKFLEHTHTLTKRLTVQACSDNTKDVGYSMYPFRFRFLAHFTLMLDFFLCQNIGWRYRRGHKKTSVQQKKKHNSCFFFFFFGGRFFCPPLSGAPGDRPYRPCEQPPPHTTLNNRQHTQPPTHKNTHTQTPPHEQSPPPEGPSHTHTHTHTYPPTHTHTHTHTDTM